MVACEFDVFEGPEERCEAVKIGFSFGAFLFGIFWALWERLGVKYIAFIFLLYIVASVAALGIGVFIGQQPEFASNAEQWRDRANSILVLFAHVYIGFQGNKWRKADLVKKGWKIAAERIEAKTAEESITNVKPEKIKENKLIKKAMKIIEEGKTEEAALIFERIIREHKDDRNVINFSKKKLKEINPSISSK